MGWVTGWESVLDYSIGLIRCVSSFHFWHQLFCEIAALEVNSSPRRETSLKL